MSSLSFEERKASLLAAIDALPASKHSPDERLPTMVLMRKDPRSLVLKAAAARRMNLSAYLRRAGYAMACHDLGIPLSEVLAMDPFVSRENGRRMRDAEGTKFGRWEIGSLVGEDLDGQSTSH